VKSYGKVSHAKMKHAHGGLIVLPRDHAEGTGEMSLRPGADGEVDIALLQDALALTPWERMQANDDALNFAESLRAAMLRRNAKPV
jgi:hypothetical protein